MFCAANHKKRFLCLGIREISINFVAEGCQAECKANSKFLWVKIIAFAVYSKTFRKLGGGKNVYRVNKWTPAICVGVQLVCMHGFPPSTSERG